MTRWLLARPLASLRLGRLLMDTFEVGVRNANCKVPTWVKNYDARQACAAGVDHRSRANWYAFVTRWSGFGRLLVLACSAWKAESIVSDVVVRAPATAFEDS